MWIELTHGTTGKPIYINIQHIAAITQHWNSPETTIVATVGDNVPWYVKETVDEVLSKIKKIENKKIEQIYQSKLLMPEELLKANPVWFETHALIKPAMIDHGESKAGFCDIVFGEYDGTDYPINKYNKTWRCWTTKPTDEQRKATPWDE